MGYSFLDDTPLCTSLLLNSNSRFLGSMRKTETTMEFEFWLEPLIPENPFSFEPFWILAQMAALLAAAWLNDSTSLLFHWKNQYPYGTQMDHQAEVVPSLTSPTSFFLRHHPSETGCIWKLQLSSTTSSSALHGCEGIIQK